MLSLHGRILPLLWGLLVFATIARGEPDRRDAFGDPLPDGALYRLGSQRFRIPSNTLSVLPVFTPDGATLALFYPGQPMRLLDVATGRAVDAVKGRLPKEGQVIVSSISRDNRYIAWKNDPGLQVIEIGSGKRLRDLETSRASSFTALAFRPDSKTLLAVREEGMLRWWDVTTGKKLGMRRLQMLAKRPSGAVVPCFDTACFSPDGALLAAVLDWDTGVREKIIHLWDTATGKELWQLTGHQTPPHSLKFSLDGRFLLSDSGEKTIRLWDMATGKQCHAIATRDEEHTHEIAISSDGKQIAIVSQAAPLKMLTLHDVEKGKERWRLPIFPANVHNMVFSPDGNRLAVVHVDGIIQFWDTKAGKPLEASGRHPGVFSSPLFSRDGATLFVGNDWKGASAWDAATGRQLRRVPGDYPKMMTANGEGLLLRQRPRASGKPKGTVPKGGIGETYLLFNPRTGEKRGEIALEDQETVLALSPDGERVLAKNARSRTDARVVAIADGRVIRKCRFPSDAVAMGCSADLKYLTCFSEETGVHVFDGATGEEVRRFERSTKEIIADPSLVLAQGADILVVWGHNSTTVWNVRTGRQLARFDTSVRIIECSKDGNYLLVVLSQSHQPNERLALVDLSSGKIRRVFDGSYAWNPGDAVFSPDGRLLAGKTTAGDPSVQLWDVLTGQPLQRFLGHDEEITDMVFSPDGRRLATTSRDTTVLVWDVTGISAEGRLRRTRLSPVEFDRLWNDLASNDVARAWRAVWCLASDAEQTPARLAKVLSPVAVTEPRQLARLLDELDHEEYTVRVKAREQLARMESALPALRKRLSETPSLEARLVIQHLLKSFADPAGQPDRRRALRGAAVLEQIGDAEAQGLLKRLAEGTAEAWQTREAKAALQRLRQR